MAAEPASRLVRLGVPLLLGLFALQATAAAVRDSVTVDEVAHVAVGITTWRTGDFGLDPINPPLSRLYLALPTLLLAPRLEARPELDEWQLGLALMREEPDRYHEIHVTARAATIVLGLGLGAALFAFTSRLHGPGAALAALFLYAFSPTVLAHGHLATVDLAAAAGFFAVVWASWAYLEAPTFSRALALGAFLGVAIALKLSSATAAALAVAALLLARPTTPASPSTRLARFGLGLGLSALTALGVVCASYGFQDFGARLGDVRFLAGGPLDEVAVRFPALRLPVPTPFLRGFDLLATGNADGARVFYLCGELSSRGWWSYHLIAFATKTPLPFVLAAVVALAAIVGGRNGARADRWIAAAVALVFVANCALNPLNLGVRHLLPAEPLLCLLVGRFVARWLVRAGERGGLQRLSAAAFGVLVLGGQLVASAVIAPRYLAYFNALAGGADRGHEWLVDSNLDWGQDLIRLREYMTRRGLESVALAYFGTVHPAVYGIRFVPLRERGSHGVAVVSPTLLVGVSSTMWQSFDRWGRGRPYEFSWLSEREPAARVGSLFVYELP